MSFPVSHMYFVRSNAFVYLAYLPIP
jgi:hypothetical protein